jgi:hypothetical protein
MAFDRARDRRLRGLDASHLFEPNTISIGIRRNHYLRAYTYAFVEMFAPQLKRALVESAIAQTASRRSVREGAQQLPIAAPVPQGI